METSWARVEKPPGPVIRTLQVATLEASIAALSEKLMVKVLLKAPGAAAVEEASLATGAAKSALKADLGKSRITFSAAMTTLPRLARPLMPPPEAVPV